MARFNPPQRSASIDVCFQLDLLDDCAVSCHAFSPSNTRLALCPNNELIFIFDGNFEVGTHQTLVKHTQRVTAIAFATDTRFASVSEDRTGAVWDFDTGTKSWIPTIVELKAPKAALALAWAPNGTRFAVGLSSKDVAICTYEEVVKCWVAISKIGKGSKAAIGAIAWHPTSRFLATGSTDHMCVVYDVNEQRGDDYGDKLVSEDANSWVNDVCFSPSGALLGYTSQDSKVRIKTLSLGSEAPPAVLRWHKLPFLRIAFIDEERLVGCGFDCMPVLIIKSGDTWSVSGSISRVRSQNVSEKRESTVSDARAAFTSQPSLKKSGSKEENPPTFHRNTITCLQIIDANKFSTSGLDGQVAQWQLQP